MAFRRIDIHHHYFPPDLAKEKINADVGWITPQENLPWSPRVSLCAMDEMSINYAVLSFPAISSGSVSDENRAVARARNVFAANVCSSHPHRFGFFATLPFLDDVEGCLQEIAYAFDHLQAQGVSFASSYGEGSAAKYLGDNRYDPIWDELDRRGATAFIHGSQTPSSTPFPHAFLGLPICEVPNETFKAAAHLVVTSKKRKFSNIKFILAHMGGTVPYLAPRVAILSRHMGCPLTPEEILEDFKTFYYETALSAYESTLAAIDVFVPSDHILFGTDFPAVSKGMAEWFTKNIEKYCEGDKDKLEGVMGNNAWKILNNVSETRTTGMT